MNIPSITTLNPVVGAELALVSIGVIKEKFNPSDVLVNLCDETEQKAKALLDNAGQKNQKAATKLLEEADKYRDEMFRALYYTVIAASHRVSNPESAEVAKNLLLKVFGEKLGIVSMPLLIETSFIEDTLEKLGGISSEDVKLLGLNELIEELADANEKFRRLYEDRAKEKNELPKSIINYIPAFYNALRIMLLYVDSHYTAEETGVIFAPFKEMRKSSGDDEPVTS